MIALVLVDNPRPIVAWKLEMTFQSSKALAYIALVGDFANSLRRGHTF